jgi:hypothetical protein
MKKGKKEVFPDSEKPEDHCGRCGLSVMGQGQSVRETICLYGMISNNVPPALSCQAEDPCADFS